MAAHIKIYAPATSGHVSATCPKSSEPDAHQPQTAEVSVFQSLPAQFPHSGDADLLLFRMQGPNIVRRSLEVSSCCAHAALSCVGCHARPYCYLWLRPEQPLVLRHVLSTARLVNRRQQ